MDAKARMAKAVAWVVFAIGSAFRLAIAALLLWFLGLLVVGTVRAFLTEGLSVGSVFYAALTGSMLWAVFGESAKAREYRGRLRRLWELSKDPGSGNADQ